MEGTTKGARALKMQGARLEAIGKALLAVMIACSLTLPTPAIAWAASGGLAAANPLAADDALDASADIWDGSIDVSWYVDAPDAVSYTLTKPAQLAGLAALVNGTSEASAQPLTFKGKTIKLGTDLWLNAEPATGYDSTGTQRVWTPIGDLDLLSIDPNGSEGAMPHYGDGKYFDGTFDGNGHVVKNLYIYRNEEGTYGGVQALFANVGGNAVIRNVGIDGGWVMGRVAAGLVAISHASEGNFPHIVGCFNTANVTGNGSTTRGVAGIFAGEEQYRGAGDSQEANYHGGAVIANCYNTGTISKYSTSSPSAGGIAGTGSVQIYGCYNLGSVDISSRYAGSLAGCLVAPGYNVGQGSGAFEGDSAVVDTYALSGCVPADDQGLQKLYNMIDADHPKGDVDRDEGGSIVKRNPGVTTADKAGFKPATWFRAPDACKELSQSYVFQSNAAAPRLYWQEGQAQWDFQAKDDYGSPRYEVWGIANQPYTGSPLKPQVTVTYDPSGTGAEEELVYLHEGSDYTVSYANNVEKGVATVTVAGTGRFYNAQTTSFSIVGSDLNEATVKPITAQWWYGPGTVEPPVTVLATNGDELKAGVDYTATITGVPVDEEGFTDGKAKATVTVKPVDEAKFTGEQSIDFTVLQASTDLKDADGDGRYEISTKADLQYLAYVSSERAGNGSVDLWGNRSFELTADIDATAHCDAGDTAYLTDRPVDPLFSYYSMPASGADDQARHGGFGATFDGAGHAITLGQTEDGLSLGEGAALALFVYTKHQGNAVFENLVINGSLNSPKGVAAGLLVMAQPGTVTVQNCTNNATAIGNGSFYGSAAGFIVETSTAADSSGNATQLVMRNCVNNGAMTSAARAAGIVGALGASTATFEDCVNNGAVTAGSTGGAGGIVALVKGADSEASAYAELDFTRCTNTGAVLVKSSGDAGGIVGWNQEPVKQMTFMRCANRGPVTYAGGGNNGAGIVGRSYSPVTIVNSYNNAKITPRNSANQPAGILGYAGIRVKDGQDYGDIVMRNVYSAGGFGAQIADAGGVVGIVWLHNRLTFENCYYETGAGCASKEIGYDWGSFSDTAIAPPVIQGECVQLDTASMKGATFASMLGSAFALDAQDDVTGAYANDGYPVLSETDTVVLDLSAPGAYQVTGDDTLSYSGADIELSNLAVRNSAGEELVQGVDYVVFYTAKGTQGTAIVQGIGAYTGSLEKSFAIEPCDLSRCRGLQVRSVNYADIAGGQATQSFTVTNPAGKVMVEGVDYEVVYSNNKAPGSAFALVRGLAPYYKGSVMRPFTITSGDLSKLKVTGVDAHYPAANSTGGLYLYEQLTTPGGYALKRSDSSNANGDYVRVFYEYNEKTGAYDLPVKVDGSHDEGKAWAYRIEKAGKYQVELRADGASVNPDTGEASSWTNGYWVGSTRATFTYGNRMENDQDVSIAGMKDAYAQTGKDLRGTVTPVLTNKQTGYELSRGTDYELSYLLYDEVEGSYQPVDSVVDAGRYKLAITGKNSWFGTREVAFRVVPQQFFIDESTMVEGVSSQYFHTGKAVKPVPSAVKVASVTGAVRTLASSDYSVSYTDAKGNEVSAPTVEGAYYVVITGKGAYQGSKRIAFAIAKPYLSVYKRTSSGKAKLVKRYTKASFERLAAADAAKNPVSALYCDADGSNWSVATSSNYVRLADLAKDAGVIWADGASVSYASGSFGGASYTYADLQKTMFYPATTAAATDTAMARKAPFVLSVTDASTKVGGSTGTTFAAEAEEANIAKASAETAPRALMGVTEADYLNAKANSGKMRGNRLVKGVDTLTITLPDSCLAVSAKKQVQTVSYNAAKAQTIASAGLYGVEGAKGAIAFKKMSGNAGLTVAGNGAITVAKGLAAGLYPITVAVSDAGKGAYPAATRMASFTIQVTKASTAFTVAGKTATVVYNAAKAGSIAASKSFVVSGAVGTVSYQKVSGDKRLAIAKGGNVTVAKGTPAGTYRVKVNATASGDANHAPKTLSATVTVKVAKAANALSAKGKTAVVKAAKLKKAKQVLSAKKAVVVKGAKGKVTYKKISGSNRLVIAKAGKVTVKKGTKQGVYSMKVKVRAAGSKNYKAAVKTVKVKVRVK